MDTMAHQTVGCEGFRWDLADPTIQKGLVRLIQKLRSMMTEEEYHSIFGIHQEEQNPWTSTASEKSPKIGVLCQTSDGIVRPHPVSPRRKSVRRAA